MSNRCPFWKDYDSVGGSISYCELAAFNRPVNPAFLSQIGYSGEKKRMPWNNGTEYRTGAACAYYTSVFDPPPIVAKMLLAFAEKGSHSPRRFSCCNLAGVHTSPWGQSFLQW